MKTITLPEVLALNSCYKRSGDLDYLRMLWGRRKSATALDILYDEALSTEDAFWITLHATDLVSDKIKRLFACDCAERALLRERDRGHEPDARSWKAIEIAREFAGGNRTTEELAAAAVAAWAAAAASAATWAAARAAANAAAWAAANAAASAATWEAETNWQRIHLIEMLEAAR